MARRMGGRPEMWADGSAQAVWNELRTLSPVHAGMSYARLEALGGIQWPCWDESPPGEPFLHSRLWEDPVPGTPAPFLPVNHDPPVDRLKPIREFNLKPREIYEYLNRFVIKQDEAKKVLSVAICDHYNHVRQCIENGRTV